MPILLGLLKQFWYVPVMLLLYGYAQWEHSEAKDARNELDTYKARAAQEVAEHKLIDAQHDKEDLLFNQKQDKDHADRIVALGTSLDAVVASLRTLQAKGGAGGGAAAQPVRPATICGDNADANRRLSDAVSDAERQTRAAIAEYQIGVANQIIRPAALQQLDLRQVRDWALRGFETNKVESK